jgi:hypothetical protein
MGCPEVLGCAPPPERLPVNVCFRPKAGIKAARVIRALHGTQAQIQNLLEAWRIATNFAESHSRQPC